MCRPGAWPDSVQKLSNWTPVALELGLRLGEQVSAGGNRAQQDAEQQQQRVPTVPLVALVVALYRTERAREQKRARNCIALVKLRYNATTTTCALSPSFVPYRPVVLASVVVS